MKLKSLVWLALVGGIASSHGATGIFGSYVDIFTTTSTVYKGENFSSKPNFQSAGLGTFNLTDILIITQSQIDTYKSGGGDVTGAEIQYRVYLTNGAAPSFATQSYGFQHNSTFTDIGGMTVTGDGDQAWGNTGDINLNPGTVGNYTVEVLFRAFTNEGDRYSSNGGSNFKATFSVVPETASTMLGLLGATLLLRRRRS